MVFFFFQCALCRLCFSVDAGCLKFSMPLSVFYVFYPSFSRHLRVILHVELDGWIKNGHKKAPRATEKESFSSSSSSFGVDEKKKERKLSSSPSSSSEAERARAEDDSGDGVRGLSDGQRRLGEVAEGEQGQNWRVEGDGDKDGRQHRRRRVLEREMRKWSFLIFFSTSFFSTTTTSVFFFSRSLFRFSFDQHNSSFFSFSFSESRFSSFLFSFFPQKN